MHTPWSTLRPRRIIEAVSNNLQLRRVERRTELVTTIHYNANGNGELARLCDLHGSDKGSLVTEGHPYKSKAHNYTDHYHRLFAQCRPYLQKVFECGLGTNNPHIPSTMGMRGKPGASLRVWRDYFPNAQIIGADIDRDILFSEDRIQTFFVDQTDPSTIARMWDEVGMVDFDLIIDDGLHTFEAGTTFFSHSINRLSQQGLYLIEDVASKDLSRYVQFFDGTPFDVDFVTLHRPRLPVRDNNLIIARRRSGIA